jgi:SAM-dependent methyltransferase
MTDTRRSYRDLAEFYDLFANNADIPFYLEIAQRFGGPILELACGTGRVSLKLVEAGHEVVGFDGTPQMLKIARAKVSKLPPDAKSRATFLEGDFTSFEIQREFPIVIIPSSFAFCISTEQQLTCLETVKKHLMPDGVFILDLYPAAAQDPEIEWIDGPTEVDGKIVKRVGHSICDFSTQIRHFTMEVEVQYPSGKTDKIQTKNTSALIFDREADLLLRMAGFEVLEEYGGWDFESYESGMKRRILVLRAIH